MEKCHFIIWCALCIAAEEHIFHKHPNRGANNYLKNIHFATLNGWVLLFGCASKCFALTIPSLADWWKVLSPPSATYTNFILAPRYIYAWNWIVPKGSVLFSTARTMLAGAESYTACVSKWQHSNIICTRTTLTNTLILIYLDFQTERWSKRWLHVRKVQLYPLLHPLANKLLTLQVSEKLSDVSGPRLYLKSNQTKSKTGPRASAGAKD